MVYATLWHLPVGSSSVPDAATCAVAAVVTPLSPPGIPPRHWQLVMTMTAMTGFWCLIASRFKLGCWQTFSPAPS